MKSSRGFTNHIAQAQITLTAVWLALGAAPLLVLLGSGPAGAAGAIAFLAAGLATPFLLTKGFEAAYGDNGCLGAVLMAALVLGARWLAGRLGAGEPARAVLCLALNTAIPWAFYGGLALAGFLREKREARAAGENPASADPAPPPGTPGAGGGSEGPGKPV